VREIQVYSYGDAMWWCSAILRDPRAGARGQSFPGADTDPARAGVSPAASCEFDIAAQSGAARAGTLTLPTDGRDPGVHARGTQGSVRTLSRTTSAPPGPRWCSRIRTTCTCGPASRSSRSSAPCTASWLDRRSSPTPVLSGVSLEGSRRLERRVEFQSHVDGSRRTLTPSAPRRSVDARRRHRDGFDHVCRGADEQCRDALERTLRWLESAEAACGAVARADGRTDLWPILQGGPIWTFAPRCPPHLIWAPGPVSPGGSRRGAQGVMYDMPSARAEATLTLRLSYGRGVPEDLVARERGVDLFDCVAPTRNGRNGAASRRRPEHPQRNT